MSYFHLLWAAAFLSAGVGSQRQPRIIGGRDIDIEEAPWQVSLQIFANHYCGGSIYSDRIIITAARCFYLFGHDSYRILYNSEYLIIAGSEFKRSRRTLAEVSAKKHHAAFKVMSPTDSEHDIGVMKLSKPFSISNQVRPIHLAIRNPAPGSEVLATGWGLTANPVDIYAFVWPEVLQGSIIPIEFSDLCKKVYPWMTKNTICTGTAGCGDLDHGTPLVFNNTLVGVFSGGLCDGPGVYSSVARYHKWLINAIGTI